MDYNAHYGGMHFLWWIFWLALLALLFFTPWGSNKRATKNSLLHTLRRTYAEGKISTQEFEERKRVLEAELARDKEKGTTSKSNNHDGAN